MRADRRPLAVAAAAVVLVALALTVLFLTRDGGDAGPAAGTTPSSATGAGTSSTTSPDAGRTVTGDASPDPDIEITPQPDEPQSAAERAAGLKAADADAAAVSVSVPSVGLTTSIEPQGLRDGKVNPLAHQVIWFTGYDRTRPGTTGTSVVAGHVVSGGGPDKFAPLEHVSKGDGVVLTYPGGEKLRLEIVRTDIVAKTDLQTDQDVWGTNDSTRRVVLVTCDDRLGFREDGHREANFVAVAEIAG